MTVWLKKHQKELINMYEIFKIEDTLAYNMFRRSNMD